MHKGSYPIKLFRCDEYGLLGCKVVWYGHIPTFQRNISPPYSGMKSDPNNKLAEAVGKTNLTAASAGLLLGLLA
jgi:hypothetical protein